MGFPSKPESASRKIQRPLQRGYARRPNKGHARAQTRLAWCYVDGIGVDASSAEAVKWFQSALQKNDTRAMLSLGHFYQKGELGLTKDPRAVLN